MFIGSLRKRIAVLQRSDTQSLSGAMIPSWPTYVTLWGEITSPTGRELMAAQQVQANISHTVTLRWPGASYTITPSMRLSYKGRFFDINAILNEDERNRTLTLLCTERVGQD